MGSKLVNTIIIVLSIIVASIIGGYKVDVNLVEVKMRNNSPFEGISSNNSLIQEIPIQGEMTVDCLDILFATYARMNTNTNTIKLYLNKDFITVLEIKSEVLGDNEYAKLDIAPLNLVKGDVLYLVIESIDAQSGNMVTVWINTESNYGQLYSLNNGEYIEQQGSLIYRLSQGTSLKSYVSNRFINLPDNLFVIILAVVIGLILKLVVDEVELLKVVKGGSNEINNSNTML